jgi:hypothetical protein
MGSHSVPRSSSCGLARRTGRTTAR